MTTLTMAGQPTALARTAQLRTAQLRTALSAAARPTTIAHSVGPARSSGPSLVAVRDGLWRVVDRSGAVLGHIERETHADGERYLARRLVMPTRRIDLGAFWRIDEAADCFR
ncbi:hypothetical protein E3O42_10600 [Cryobacterium adonitolivorans]|uniref:DNA mismatch repair protein n=1 Tax=Cryobacterium adonitolivorans TaxID=1259189 RepID=A0A4R8W489_9MICO|nr:hypothetical protein [Cryobacterium adonitolivorans]TFC01384.1 hypothetical protein E3O42_10600 [Cryobacterium adonitolivorans]